MGSITPFPSYAGLPGDVVARIAEKTGTTGALLALLCAHVVTEREKNRLKSLEYGADIVHIIPWRSPVSSFKQLI